MEKTNGMLFTNIALNYSLRNEEADLAIANMLDNKDELPLDVVAENINEYLENVNKKNILVGVKGAKYFYDNERKSIVFSPSYTHEQILLGNGEINLFARVDKDADGKDILNMVFSMSSDPALKRLLNALSE